MHRKGAIDRGETWQALEEGLQPLRHPRRHHRRCDPLGAGEVARHREHERACAPGAAIGVAEQRVKQRERGVALARYAEAERKPAGDLGIRPLFEREPIVALGAFLFADQVIGEAAVASELRGIEAVGLRHRKIAERLPRAFGANEDRRLACLQPGVARVDLFGARE